LFRLLTVKAPQIQETLKWAVISARKPAQFDVIRQFGREIRSESRPLPYNGIFSAPKLTTTYFVDKTRQNTFIPYVIL